MSTIVESKTVLPAGTWNVDPVHSRVGFAVDYMGGTFHGTFAPVEATLTAGEHGVSLTGGAPVAGVTVQDKNLAAHLQSPEFFDAERHPEIRFASTSVERGGDRITVDGELTVRGVTKPVVLTGTVREPAEDPYGNLRFVLKLETTVDRSEFGLDWNAPLPNGEPALANEVTLSADLYLVKA